MTLERGDVVAVSDPFDDNETRPFVVVNTDDHPFHGQQYVALMLTTRTWFDGTIPLSDGDFVEGGVPDDSSVVPWGVASPGESDVGERFGRLRSPTVDDAVEALTTYLR
ncbi:type II toxin-antitoxin system PemK/MazF family toxin [Halosimplex halobium]|uniref:type II toxin-antitoxin system PemK/MazF family toxin n=1 Tax=Halosimplex halobium TaxID=3396618 RepID=UPI003F556EE4